MGQFDRTPRRRRQNPSNDQPEKNEMKSYALAAIAAILLASNGAMGKRSLMEHHHDKEIVTTASAISGSSSYSSGHEAYTTAGTVTDVTGHAGAAAAIAGGVPMPSTGREPPSLPLVLSLSPLLLTELLVFWLSPVMLPPPRDTERPKPFPLL